MTKDTRPKDNMISVRLSDKLLQIVEISRYTKNNNEKISRGEAVRILIQHVPALISKIDDLKVLILKLKKVYRLEKAEKEKWKARYFELQSRFEMRKEQEDEQPLNDAQMEEMVDRAKKTLKI